MVFQSLLSGQDLTLDVCTFEEVLPYSLMSIPISTITPSENVWIATSMLSRISDVTNNLVVMEDEFPIGTISSHEIIDGLQKNPTSQYFEESVTKIMNPDFHIDSRNVNLANVLKRMNKAKSPFTIIENDRTNFSQFSIKQVLEIGALCKDNFAASLFAKKQLPVFSRDDKISDIIKKLEGQKLVVLEGNFSFVNHEVLLEKIKEFSKTQNENLLDLSASTLKIITPTLISDKLTIAEMCRIMNNLKNPCVMTSERIITPYDILEVLCKEI
jgi:predicted transcriptional regulator